METFLKFALAATAGAVLAIVVVLMIDPACGSSGDSQRACAHELATDIAAIVRR